MELLTPGLAPPVDMFPTLKYMPKFLAKWKNSARELRKKKQRAWYYMMLDTAKEELKKGAVELDHKSIAYGH